MMSALMFQSLIATLATDWGRAPALLGQYPFQSLIATLATLDRIVDKFLELRGFNRL